MYICEKAAIIKAGLIVLFGVIPSTNVAYQCHLQRKSVARRLSSLSLCLRSHIEKAAKPVWCSAKATLCGGLSGFWAHLFPDLVSALLSPCRETESILHADSPHHRILLTLRWLWPLIVTDFCPAFSSVGILSTIPSPFCQPVLHR